VQQLGDAELAAAAHGVGMDEASLRRPHVALEPGVERKVVGETAKQRHRDVGMAVDQPRDDEIAGGVDRLRRAVRRGDVRPRANCHERAVANRECAVRKDRPPRIHGDHNAAEHEHVYGDRVPTQCGNAHRPRA
jgi:hypothetical protein